MNKISKRVILVGLIFLGLLEGCGKKQGGEIRIGAILPLSGPAAVYGEAGQRGILLAKDFFIQKHPEFLNKAEIRFEDDKASPKDGLSAFQKLKTDDIHVIVGPMVSGVALAVVSSLSGNNEVLIILPTATTPKLRGVSPNVFRTCVSDDAEGLAMAQYCAKSRLHGVVAILHISNEYGLGMATAFKSTFEAKGGKIAAIEAYDAAAMDFRNVILKVLKVKPDVIFLVGQKEQAQVISQLHELSFSGQILGTTMFEDPAIFALSAARDAIFSSRVLNNGALDNKPHPFFNAFRERFGSDANYYAAACFDAATVALEAARLHDEENLDLTAAPRRIGLEKGATGSLSFDEKNDVQQEFVIKQIVNGKTVVLEN